MEHDAVGKSIQEQTGVCRGLSPPVAAEEVPDEKAENGRYRRQRHVRSERGRDGSSGDEGEYDGPGSFCDTASIEPGADS
jgi:hypothetical protein